VYRPDGEVDYFVAVVEDINERKRAEAQLVEAIEKQQRAIEDLDRISKAKSYFVSLVGHEFRTALTGIQGFSELLAEHDFGPAEVKEFAREIHSEGLRLTRMISEMLDLDRMESGRMKLNYGPVDLNALVTDVVERFGSTSQLHQFVTALAPDLGAIQADSDKLTQVISNLVANAIKYAPKGGEILLTTRGEPGDVVLSVKDEGLGVPAEALETIFERYARHEAKDRELIKGTGLGLPVVRQIVEMHGGQVWAENNGVERGATFTFRIPRAQPAAVGSS
jgi:signal transduction histidine kinase